MRKKSAQKPAKKQKKSLGTIIAYVFIFLLVLGLLFTAVVYRYVKVILADTPPIEIYDINELLEENSFIYDNQGNIIEKVEDNGLRTIVPYDKIDDDMKKTIVAVEDKTFWDHHGFNYVRLVGAVLESLGSGKDPSGTSTITQQYARNMYLPETRFASGAEGYKRKVQEAFYSVDLEKNLSKEEILGAYLNTIEFGANTKGIQAATMRYFSKNADEIDYIEAAILSGIPQANTSYSPFKIVRTVDLSSNDYVLGEDSNEYTIVFNETCLDRYKIVLSVMKSNGVIDENQYEYAKNYDIRERLKPTPLQTSELSSYFTDMVKDEVIKKFMQEKGMSEEDARNVLYRGGLRIHTTLDSAMQAKLDNLFDGEAFTNVYDQDTTNAVYKFQEKYGLNADGICGMGTLEKMLEKGLIYSNEMPTAGLNPGDETDSVITLKQGLEKAGLLYRHNPNMPSMEAFRDGDKNILRIDEDDWGNSIGSSVMLNKYENVISLDGDLIIKPNNFYVNDNGDTVFKHGMMFNFFPMESQDTGEVNLELFIKNLYKCDEDSVYYLYGGGSLYNEKVSIEQMYIYSGYNVTIDNKYKSENADGEYVLAKEYFAENKDIVSVKEDGTIVIKKGNFFVDSQGVIQPQASMSIIDYRTGELKAIAGGRNVKGQMIFNRAIKPRQPGSSIKPLGVYSPCLDNGFSPASVIEDVPYFSASGSLWPRNWYGGYKGSVTMREMVVQSGNVAAVKFLKKIGEEKGLEYLQKFGISTLKTDGEVNDKNVSAIALGGMSWGATNFDMTGAFGAIANGGVRKETVTFTKIFDKNNNLIFENIPKKTFIFSEQVAWLMEDMMKSAAMGGFTNNIPAIRSGNYGIPVVGKTGTTSNNYDIWYCGYSPYYASSMWIGSDVNLKLAANSLDAARFWSKVNIAVHDGYEDKDFKSGSELGLIRVSVDSKSGLLPSSLSYKDPSRNGVITDWFIPGTQPTEVDHYRFTVPICELSNKIATKFCPPQYKSVKVYRRRTEDVSEAAVRIGISDQSEIAPSNLNVPKEGEEFVVDNLDYKKIAQDGKKSPYCYIHTNENKSADSTAGILAGVSTLDRAEGGKIITQSIIITTVFDSEFQVDAGSVIYSSGTLVTLSGKTIYPWQIKSYKMNPNGPKYKPGSTNNQSDADDNKNSNDTNNEITNQPDNLKDPDNSNQSNNDSSLDESGKTNENETVNDDEPVDDNEENQNLDEPSIED